MQRVAALLLTLVLALASQPSAGRTPDGATLTIISGQVAVQLPGAARFGPARDGHALPVGAVVRTGSDGRATLTFFDGTTATLDPDTEVVVARVEPATGTSDGLLMTLQLSAGRVWAQVASLFDRGSTFEVQAAGASAVAREGTFGYRLAADGTLACWAIAGTDLTVRRGADTLVLRPGEQAVIPADAALPPPAAREFGPGLLEVQTEGAVLARVVDPRGLTVGFPSGEFVVNQVVDATTSLPSVPDRWLQLRGPVAGHYTLILQPEAAGPFVVRVMLERDDALLGHYEWTDEGRLGEALVAELVVDSGVAGPAALRATAPQPAGTPLPGHFHHP
ncbi:MAG: FecR domain-containing protein [Chloroflexi bacterium]|nr:FecR domain-containing protein [Chloroflexota bacterium]